MSAVSEPEAADAVAEVFGRWGRGVAIDQPVLDAPDGDGGWIDPERNVVVKTYIPLDAEAEDKRRLLEEAAWHLGRLRHVEPLQTRTLAEEDWANAWKRFFYPHRVGRRLVVVPSWRRQARRPDDVIVRLDPGMAFGTGLHPTTRMCMALLEEHLSPGDAVLDFGCGSAILSIAAARLGAARVTALEVDAVAVRVAEENVRRNTVVRKVRIYPSSIEPGIPIKGAPFDLVVANISALVLTRAVEGLRDAVKPGHYAILSGILAAGEAGVRAAYTAAGWQYVETRTEGDWIAMVVRRDDGVSGVL
ncbi:MAG: 50S ribosomal protein L11 methyltransferase [Chloroflexi bacterium]|nr:50S ribosomal protein L11 methyltransferase [Chloroflexota bacterium]